MFTVTHRHKATEELALVYQCVSVCATYFHGHYLSQHVNCWLTHQHIKTLKHLLPFHKWEICNPVALHLYVCGSTDTVHKIELDQCKHILWWSDDWTGQSTAAVLLFKALTRTEQESCVCMRVSVWKRLWFNRQTGNLCQWWLISLRTGYRNRSDWEIILTIACEKQIIMREYRNIVVSSKIKV